MLLTWHPTLAGCEQLLRTCTPAAAVQPCVPHLSVCLRCCSSASHRWATVSPSRPCRVASASSTASDSCCCMPVVLSTRGAAFVFWGILAMSDCHCLHDAVQVLT